MIHDKGLPEGVLFVVELVGAVASEELMFLAETREREQASSRVCNLALRVSVGHSSEA